LNTREPDYETGQAPRQIKSSRYVAGDGFLPEGDIRTALFIEWNNVVYPPDGLLF
jgi:hypothetical protein